jgi:carotenoid cleavage dioxygenase-like enzyme
VPLAAEDRGALLAFVASVTAPLPRPAPPAGHRALFENLGSEVTDVPLRVEGRLPAWLGGALLRNGPARFDLGRQHVAHWFDGLAMLHRFAFAQGTVRYTNRFLRTRAFEAAERTGRLGYREFASDPCGTLFSRLRSLLVPEPSDNASVSVARLGEHVVALTECALPVAFDPRTLATIGPVRWSAATARRTALHTAHPHAEPATDDAPRPDIAPRVAGGALVNQLTCLGARCRYEVVRTDATTGDERVLARIPVRRPSYMHSFAITRRRVVLSHFPFTVAPAAIVLSGRPFIENFTWRPDEGTTWHVVPRDGGRPVACRGEPLFAFHHVNAFDDGDDVLCDVIAYDDPSVIDALRLARLREAVPVVPGGTLRRLRLVPPRRGAREGTVREEGRVALPVEMPRIDEARVDGRRYRIAYASAARASGGLLDGIARLDVERGDVRAWHDDGCYAGEPVFVPRPGARAEDDGALLSVVLDGHRERSFLLVLDARTLGELARAEAPHVIPAGFHGAHLPE